MSKYPLLVLIGALILTVACGNGSGSSSGASSSNNNTSGCAGTTPAGAASNVQAITVDGGPFGGYPEAAFATVTICVPKSSACQNIDHVLVDTGSYGLRVLASGAAQGELSPTLLPKEFFGVNPIVECAPFLSFLTWGPVEMADVKLAPGEIAYDIPIQVIGDSNFPDTELPAACLNFGGTPVDGLTGNNGLHANGILGIGVFPDDCGIGCTESGSNNPDLYYTCPSGNCQVAVLASETQNVQNPVSSLSQDNNGTIIELPAISSSGAATVNGSLVFGIGTQSNNGLNGATALGLSVCTTTSPSSCNDGDFTTIYKGTSYPDSFVDSGSNGIFFLTSSLTGIPGCTGDTDFYCPASTESLSATNEGVNGNTKVTSFTVANADRLNGNFFAFNDRAGPGIPPSDTSSSGSANYFDWGMPFFFGCNVFTAIYGEDTPAGAGPYVAY